MISEEDSLPTRSKKGLLGQGVLWTQFNDVNFYIEDVYQENLYLRILQKIFPDIRLKKIFPLGGKGPVISKALNSLGNKKRVFIVDRDFDDILDLKQDLPNLFYLDRYSIENYVFEQDAIFELVREENPKIKIGDIKSQFKLKEFLDISTYLLADLSAHFLLIRKFELGIKFLSIEPSRDYNLQSTPKYLKDNATADFFAEVKTILKSKKSRLKYLTQLKAAKKHFRPFSILKNVPGKYLVNLLKAVLKKYFHFVQCSFDTFLYRLAKNCQFDSLSFLKANISLYLG